MIMIYRASELYSTPARPAHKGKPARPAKRGKFGVGKTAFYSEIEPKLEKARLGKRAVGYTERSIERIIEESIAAAAVERAVKQAT
jgi:hypothetical protein